MQLWMIQVETFRGSFCCHLGFCLVWSLVWFFVLFSEVKKLFPKFVFQKDARSRLRNQCKEISKVPERKAVNCHQEKKKKDESWWKKDWPYKYGRVTHKLHSMPIHSRARTMLHIYEEILKPDIHGFKLLLLHWPLFKVNIT